MYTKVNNIAPKMTEQLQGTNLIANDTSDETCEFLLESIVSWFHAVRAPDVDKDPSDPFLLNLELGPDRGCFKQTEDLLYHYYCEPILETYDNASLIFDQRDNITLEMCQDYDKTEGMSTKEVSHALGLRPGSVLQFHTNKVSLLEGSPSIFSVTTTFDETYSIEEA